jgi:ligand-binding sensor domain-containing protein/signal transduction histidine kinase
MVTGNGQFRITTWTTSQGLPGNWIECLQQTRDGYLGLGTPEGLVRFDGVRFVRFNHENCSAFRSDVVKALTEDTNGVLWVATKAGGVLCFGPNGVQPISAAEGLPSDTINALSEHRDGGMWVATTAGLTLVTADGMRHYSDARAQHPGVFAVLDDGLGRVWVATEGALQTLDVAAGTFETVWSHTEPTPETGPAPAPAASSGWPTPDRIFSDRHGHLWFCVDGTIRRLREGRVEVFAVQPAAIDRRTKAMFEDRDGRLWAVIGNLVHLWTGERFEAKDRVLGVEDALVNGMIEDAQGNFGIGSRRGGLTRCMPTPLRVLTRKDGLPHNSIRAVSARREGGVWLATAGGVGFYHGESFEMLTTAAWPAAFAANTVFEDSFGTLWCETSEGPMVFIAKTAAGYAPPVPYPTVPEHGTVVQDARTNLWMSGPRGLSRLLLVPGEFVWRADPPGPVRTTHAECWTYSPDQITRWTPAELWAFDRARWSKRTLEAIEPFAPEQMTRKHQEVFDSMLPRRESTSYDIRCALCDRAGTLWFGTRESGLQRFRDNDFVALTARDGLASEDVRCLHEDADGALWIGTARGIGLVQADRVASITAAHGLPSQAVAGIVANDHGALWIAFDAGFYRVSKEELRAVAEGRMAGVEGVLYDEADGVLTGATDGVTQPTTCRTPDGLLWFATAQGLVRVEPGAVRPRPHAPVVQVEELRAAGLTLDVTSRPATPIPAPSGANSPAGSQRHNAAGRFFGIVQESDVRLQPSAFTLPPGSGRSLEIHYTALDLSAPQALRFRHKLEGVNEDWVDAGERRVAYYNRLGPGRYRFEVQAIGKSGAISARDVVFSFAIAPYIHEARWFWVLCGVMTVGAAGWATRGYLRRLRQVHERKEQASLDRERARIAADVHDHIGNSLTQIAITSEVARRTMGDAAAMDAQLEALSATAQQTVDELGELEWLTEARCESLGDFIGSLREYAARLFENSGIEGRLLTPTDVPGRPVSGAFRRDLFLLLKEALGNALRHSSATRVEMRMETGNEFLEILAADNGRGFVLAASGIPGQDGSAIGRQNSARGRSPSPTPGPAHHGHGMANMQRRAAALGAVLEVRSTPGQGTRLRLQVPLAVIGMTERP